MTVETKEVYNKTSLTPENIYPNPSILFIDLLSGYSQDSLDYLKDRLDEQKYNQLDIVKMNSVYKEQSLSSCNLIKEIYYNSTYLVTLLVNNKVIQLDKSGAVLNELIRIISGENRAVGHSLNNVEVDRNVKLAYNKLSYEIDVGRLKNPRLTPAEAIRYVVDHGKTNYGITNIQIVPSLINNLINYLKDSSQYYLTGDYKLYNKNK